MTSFFREYRDGDGKMKSLAINLVHATALGSLAAPGVGWLGRHASTEVLLVVVQSTVKTLMVTQAEWKAYVGRRVEAISPAMFLPDLMHTGTLYEMFRRLEERLGVHFLFDYNEEERSWYLSDVVEVDSSDDTDQKYHSRDNAKYHSRDMTALRTHSARVENADNKDQLVRNVIEGYYTFVVER